MGRESTFASRRPYRGAASPKKGAAVFEIDVNEVCEVAPLPKQVRERWNGWESTRESERDVSLEEITARLERARQKREDFQRWVMRKQVRSSHTRPSQEELRAVRAKKLEEKMALAEQNRLSTLEAVRLKAAAMHQRTEVVAERISERQDLLAQKLFGTLQAAEMRRLAIQEAEKERLSAAHQLVFARLSQIQQKEEKTREIVKECLDAKMVQADALREARLAAAAAKAGSKVRHAKHVSKMRRLNEERCSKMKRRVLDSKLQTAADRRREDVTVRSAVNAEKSETQFLKRQAAKREKLRRQGCSRRLQQFWRTFRDGNCTTRELARSFISQGVTNLANPTIEDSYKQDQEGDTDSEPAVMVGGPTAARSVWNDSFEEFASRLQSQATLSAARKLLGRLGTRLTVTAGGTHECTALLTWLFPKAAKKGTLERYPVRVFLCAYMIINHPEVVFNRKGAREAHLSAAAKDMITMFEKMLEKIMSGGLMPGYSSGNESPGGFEPIQRVRSTTDWDAKFADIGEFRTVGEALVEFDALWVSYLEQFVAWKSHDAAGLESELIRMAAELEASMLRKCKGDINSPRVQRNSDLQAVIQQVAHDHKLLRERIQRLTGDPGVQKMDAALAEVREKVRNEVFLSSTEDSESDSSNRSQSPRRRRGGKPPRNPNVRPSPGELQSYGNEALVWELLYDPSWRFPMDDAEEDWDVATGSQDEAVASLQLDASGMSVAKVGNELKKQVRRITEKAFWDSIEWQLASQAEGAGDQLLNMLAEIGRDLAEVLPKTAAEEVAAVFQKSELVRLLSGSATDVLGGVDTNGLLQLVQHTSELLKAHGAPVRDEKATQCHEAVRTEIMEALGKEGEDKKKELAKAVTKAMRLLFAQLKVLRMDIANARLKMLADSMAGPAAMRYVRGKFNETFGLDSSASPEGVSSALPKTRAWLREAASIQQDLVPMLREVLEGDGDSQRQSQRLPTAIRSGVRSSGGSTSESQQRNVRGDTALVAPVGADGWQCAVRIGLAQVISGDTPALPENIPETLQLDAKRLHRAQEIFQKLLVMSAAMLILQQNASKGGPSMSPEKITEAKERLSVVLSDPQMKLPTLTTELARLAGTPDKETEGRMQTALLNLIVTRGNGGFRALCNGLTKALQILLAAGPDNEGAKVKSAVRDSLVRIGAVFLVDDVVELGKDLGWVAGVNEAVHSALYDSLFDRA
ncbi:hypothetical protein BSKO_08639 [Bryopsis sp. KO-2023]|nr:hypothetical protein BSKO_08639 [Bryopsis sp. KO-2023]